MNFIIWLTRIVGSLALILTLLPLMRTGFWFVRGWDFPRIHIAVTLAIVGILAFVIVLKTQHRREFAFWLIALTAAFFWQAGHVIVFTPIWSPEVAVAPQEADTYSITTINLNFTNKNFKTVNSEIEAINPDVLILIEIDRRWQDGLEKLSASYPNQHNEIRDEGTGIAVWSKLKIESATTKFVLEEDRPSIWATVAVDELSLNLVAVHPTPPGLPADDRSPDQSRRDSRLRDAELTLIAKTIADNPNQPWLVAGDFNDVAWSHTTRLFKRISGLKDPRVGRSYMGTFHSGYPLCRFPIDHVFVSDGFTIRSLSRQFITGSDHFAMTAVVTHSKEKIGATPEPQLDDRDDAEELIDEGQADAKKRNIAVD